MNSKCFVCIRHILFEKSPTAKISICSKISFSKANINSFNKVVNYHATSKFKLSDYKGKQLAINFKATSCATILHFEKYLGKSSV